MNTQYLAHSMTYHTHTHMLRMAQDGTKENTHTVINQSCQQTHTPDTYFTRKTDVTNENKALNTLLAKIDCFKSMKCFAAQRSYRSCFLNALMLQYFLVPMLIETTDNSFMDWFSKKTMLLSKRFSTQKNNWYLLWFFLPFSFSTTNPTYLAIEHLFKTTQFIIMNMISVCTSNKTPGKTIQITRKAAE